MVKHILLFPAFNVKHLHQKYRINNFISQLTTAFFTVLIGLKPFVIALF